MDRYIKELIKEYAGIQYLPYAKHFTDQFGSEFKNYECPREVEWEILKRLRKVKGNNLLSEYVLRSGIKDCVERMSDWLRMQIIKECTKG